MTGKFALTVSSPRGSRKVTGKYIAVTLNPSTLQVMDFGISNTAPPVSLRSLGPISTLIK